MEWFLPDFYGAVPIQKSKSLIVFITNKTFFQFVQCYNSFIEIKGLNTLEILSSDKWNQERYGMINTI